LHLRKTGQRRKGEGGVGVDAEESTDEAEGRELNAGEHVVVVGDLKVPSDI
jgi:hypothetical protein